MRALIRTLLISDGVLSSLIEDRVYPVNIRDTKPDQVPYLVYRLGVTLPRIVPAENESLQLWAHDNRGDYEQIDEILDRAIEVLTEVESQGSLVAIEWVSTSEDQYDEATNTLTRFAQFRIVTVTL